MMEKFFAHPYNRRRTYALFGLVALGAILLQLALPILPSGTALAQQNDTVPVCHMAGNSGNVMYQEINQNAWEHRQEQDNFFLFEGDASSTPEMKDQWCMDNAPDFTPGNGNGNGNDGDDNDIGSVTITKMVSGGTATSGAFTLMVNGMPVTSGVASTTMATGTYAVTESPNDPNYEASFSGDCDSDGMFTLGEDDIECVMTNTFVGTTTATTTATTTSLKVTKVVVGGTASSSDFSLFVNGMSITNGVASTTIATGTYAVTESPTTTDYVATFSGDCNSSGMVTVTEGEQSECTITNTFVPAGICPAGGEMATSTGMIVSDTNTMVGTSSAATLTFVHPGWTADFGSSTADWIWATDPVADPGTTTVETFTRTFTVNGTTTDATLDIATDNNYRVWINGDLVGSDTSGGSFTLSTQDQFDATSFLDDGSNTLTIEVTNTGVASSTASENPAGLMYQLTWSATDCASTTSTSTPEVNTTGGGGGGGGGSNSNNNGGGGGGSNGNNGNNNNGNGQVLGATSFIPSFVYYLTPNQGQVLGETSYLPGMPSTGADPRLLPMMVLALLGVAGAGVICWRLLSRPKGAK